MNPITSPLSRQSRFSDRALGSRGCSQVHLFKDHPLGSFWPGEVRSSIQSMTVKHRIQRQRGPREVSGATALRNPSPVTSLLPATDCHSAYRNFRLHLHRLYNSTARHDNGSRAIVIDCRTFTARSSTKRRRNRLPTIALLPTPFCRHDHLRSFVPSAMHSGDDPINTLYTLQLYLPSPFVYLPFTITKSYPKPTVSTAIPHHRRKATARIPHKNKITEPRSERAGSGASRVLCPAQKSSSAFSLSVDSRLRGRGRRGFRQAGTSSRALHAVGVCIEPWWRNRWYIVVLLGRVGPFSGERRRNEPNDQWRGSEGYDRGGGGRAKSPREK